MSSPRIISRSEHPISRSQITQSALKTLYTLKDAGYEAHIVGGGVRDLLLRVQPKDFDIATSALPDEVRKLFRNCRLIGRRFRLAHVYYGADTIEVATFRAAHSGDEHAEVAHLDEGGRILRDNVYGTLEEDVWRRDFTINALYYGIHDFSIRDYVGGMEDIAARRLRLIGDPEQRYREDPVRMLRAVRLAAKLNLTIDPASEAPIRELGALLASVPPARLFDESLKLFLQPAGLSAFRKLQDYGLLPHLFPDIGAASIDDFSLIEKALANTAQRIVDDRSVSPTFLFAALLWAPARQVLAELGEGFPGPDTFWPLLDRQLKRISIPKRFSIPMREIWGLQARFPQRGGKRPQRLLTHPSFRAAYDFLLLRAEVGQADPELAQWWTQFQHASPEARVALPSVPGAEEGPKRRRRRRPRGKKPASAPV